MSEAVMIFLVLFGLLFAIALIVWAGLIAVEGSYIMRKMVEHAGKISNHRDAMKEVELMDDSYAYKESDIARLKEKIKIDKVALDDLWDRLKFILALPLNVIRAFFEWASGFKRMITILMEKE